ncbi:MAG: DJ-1/PfpI family protein [Kineosporiaceae bacterium]
MTALALAAGGGLDGRRIAILMESDYYEPEIFYYERRFAEEGARVDLVSRLWGQPSLQFTGHEFRAPIAVTHDLGELEGDGLLAYDALVVPSGMVSDRLRYTEDVTATPPATRLLARAVAESGLVVGIVCHGLWLAAPLPDIVRGRSVTCHNNLVGDARNMGARYVDADVVLDGDLLTGRAGPVAHLFARELVHLLRQRPEGGVR